MKTNLEMLSDSFDRRTIKAKDMKIKLLYKVFQTGDLMQHALLFKRLRSNCDFIIRNDNPVDVIARK